MNGVLCSTAKNSRFVKTHTESRSVRATKTTTVYYYMHYTQRA